MSVTVKVYGLAEYSSPEKLVAALKEFFSEKFSIATYDINVLFLACDSRVTGSPLLVEVGITPHHVCTPELLRELTQVFYKPTANREVITDVFYRNLSYHSENPERQPKTHAGQDAFPDWRKQPEKA